MLQQATRERGRVVHPTSAVAGEDTEAEFSGNNQHPMVTKYRANEAQRASRKVDGENVSKERNELEWKDV